MPLRPLAARPCRIRPQSAGSAQSSAPVVLLEARRSRRWAGISTGKPIPGAGATPSSSENVTTRKATRACSGGSGAGSWPPAAAPASASSKAHERRVARPIAPRRLARLARGLELGQVPAPVVGLVATEFVQRAPGIDAGLVPVVELEQHGVVADRDDLVDVHVALAVLQDALARTMAHHLGRRRVHAQVLARQAEQLARLVADLQHMRGAMQRDPRGSRRGAHDLDTRCTGFTGGGAPATCASASLYGPPNAIAETSSKPKNEGSISHSAFGVI